MPTGSLALFLWLFGCIALVACSPAKPFGRYSNAGLGNTLNNVTSTVMLPPKLNASNSDPVICHVSNTRTVLLIKLIDQNPLEPVAMALTINAAKAYVDRKLKDGDGWLPHSKDPFRFDINIGVSIGAKSKPNEHLTWGILSSTLRGLRECLLPNEWYDEAIFKIFDSDWGPVGVGSLVGYERRAAPGGSLRIDDSLDRTEA